MTSPEAKQFARDLFLKTLPHLDVAARMRETVHARKDSLEIAGTHIPLALGRPLSVVAIGKAALEMTDCLVQIMPQVGFRSVVAAPSVPRTPLPGFEYFEAGHPIPNQQSWLAAEAALAMLDRRNVTPEDLTIFLISGGGSAMMEKPLDPAITLGKLQEFYRALFECGASITEINTLRKHFSMIKGGRLAQVAAPMMQLTLYVSDVPDNQHEMIASGPTMPDTTTFEDCLTLLERQELRAPLAQFRDSFAFISKYHEPTPKPGDRWFAHSLYNCLLSNQNAVDEMAKLVKSGGVLVDTDTGCDDWGIQAAADYLLIKLRELRERHPGKPVAVIGGGELSCPVTGHGKGGRNQAFVLDCAQKIIGDRIVVLSAGTDGIDGNSPATGAVADGESIRRAQALGMNALEYQANSDSFRFFEKLGDTITTGPTGTNVRDLRLLLAY